MSTVTTVTTKPKGKPVNFSASLGQFRTLKNLKITVTLTAEPGELNKILQLVTACQTGNSLALSAQVISKKKDAKEKPNTQNKHPRRARTYPYR